MEIRLEKYIQSWHSMIMSLQPSFPIEVLTCAQMTQVDRDTIAQGIPASALMEIAGRAVGAKMAQLVSPGQGPILLLCGPGNNGGDGWVAARYLQEQGYATHISTLKDLSHLSLSPFVGVVDALFGSGLTRPLDASLCGFLAQLSLWQHATQAPILAVDIPSGIQGDTGFVLGQAVKATHTLAICRRKPAHFLYPGRDYCGKIDLAPLPVSQRTISHLPPLLFANEPALWQSCWPFPKLSGHKYDRGHVLALSGPCWQTGAIRLAGQGALRMGAGLVTIAAPSNALSTHAAHVTALLLRSCDTPSDLASLLEDKRKNVAILGPGLMDVTAPDREGVQAYVERALTSSLQACVLDADALTCFAQNPDRLQKYIKAQDGMVVLTPHQGEFDRLFHHFEAQMAHLPKTRWHQAVWVAQKMGAILVLKGPDCVVAEPSGRAAILSLQAPYLATAGAGDVLAGMIAGLLAQNMPAFEATCAAVFLHAFVAHSFGLGFIAEDFHSHIPHAIRTFLPQEG